MEEGELERRTNIKEGKTKKDMDGKSRLHAEYLKVKCDRLRQKRPLRTKSRFCVCSTTLKYTPCASCCNEFCFT